jgi:hypothetical protein
MADVREPAAAESFVLAAQVLGRIRGAKTRDKRNLRWPVTKVSVQGPEEAVNAFLAVSLDVRRAGVVSEGALFTEVSVGAVEDGERLRVEVELAEEAGT